MRRDDERLGMKERGRGGKAPFFFFPCCRSSFSVPFCNSPVPRAEVIYGNSDDAVTLPTAPVTSHRRPHLQSATSFCHPQKLGRSVTDTFLGSAEATNVTDSENSRMMLRKSFFAFYRDPVEMHMKGKKRNAPLDPESEISRLGLDSVLSC